MGLDNGIRIENIKFGEYEEIPGYINPLYDEDAEEIEICYMRKCWGIRDEIIFALKDNADEDNYAIKSVRDIDKLITIFRDFMIKAYYNENHRSIWSYSDMIIQLGTDLGCLYWLRSIFKDHPEMKVYFYDSY